MRIVRPELEINPENPFEHDKLNRENKCIELTNLIQKVSDPLVINLDAQWGEGKTTFIKMWQAHLQKAGITGENPRGYHSIYIDAFTHDYMDDPFIAIATSVYAEVKEKFPQHKELLEKAETFKEKAVSTVKKGIAFGTGLAVRVASQGLFGSEEVGDVADDIAKQSGDAVSRYLKSKFESNAEKLAIAEFQQVLSELGEAVRKAQDFPLVIVVDELDRCRPTFAVEVLEKIKHLFSVPNVTFVLVTNNQQLECSIKAIYGESIDAGLYLQKFITLSFYLPKAAASTDKRYYMNFCRKLVDDHGFEDVLPSPHVISTQMSAIAEYYNLSLRQVEKAIQRLALLYSVASYESRELAVLLAAWSTMSSSLLHKILKGDTSLDKLVKEFELEPLIKEMELKQHTRSNKRALWAGVAWVIRVCGTEEEREQYSDEIAMYTTGEPEWGPKKELAAIAERLVGYAI